MWTTISVFFALVIHFSIPPIPESKKSVKTDNYLQIGFPYNYYEGENLTAEELNYRIKVIYATCFTYLTITFTLAPVTTQAILPFSVASIERSITRDSTQEKLLLDLRGGGGDLSELIIKLILIWTMSKNCKTVEGFQPKPINHPHFGQVQRNPRIVQKLQENPVTRNNPGLGSCRSSNNGSMDELAKSLSPKYLNFQKKYYSEALGDRFEPKNYSVSEFKELARDPRENQIKYDRASIDEARAIIQARSENLVSKPTRPDMETARRVDLDFKVQGPDPFTHVDVKNPVGSEVLKKQSQSISVEDMAYKIGQKIVIQKHKFLNLENGPAGPENVGHIVDLCYVPAREKAIVKEKILQGAREAGSAAGILFLNDI